MKLFISLFLIVPPILSLTFAQEQNKVLVKGNNFEILLGNMDYKFIDEQKNNFVVRDYYEFTNESSSGEFKLPSTDVVIAIPTESKPEISLASFTEKKYTNIVPALNPAVQMINDSTISRKELDYSERKVNLNNKPTVEIKGYLWLREFYCVHLKIQTHKYDEKDNVLTELADIKLTIGFKESVNINNYSPLEVKSQFDENLKLVLANPTIAEQFRSSPKIILTDTTGNWINYSSNYLRIGTANDGIYRITKSDLENYGISTTGINPKTFRLFESGSEKPIYVGGESDLTFDNGDYIEFYGTKNYSKISPRVINAKSQPYNNYLDKYTDTTIYFLTWGASNGLRAQINSTFQSTVTDTINYFTSFSHLEENPMDALFYTFHDDLVESQFPFWDTGKGWYWQWLATWATPINFTIATSDITPNKTAKFYGKVVSRGSNGSTNVHLTKLLINNVVIDSQVTSRYQRVLLQGSINSSSLINGNNTLKISYSEANGASGGQMVIDWVEAEYPKKLKLINNSLYFEFKDITSTALRMIKIENVTSSNYLLYKIKPKFQKITGFSVSGNNLYFTDTVSNGDAYFIISTQTGSFFTPKFFKYKTFVNLRSQNTQVDYLGITHPSFFTSVNNYVNYISSSFSVTSQLVSVDDIYDEFGYGYPTAEAIRDFVIYKFQSAPQPKPSYLVLFGDANYDFKKYRTISQGIVGGGNFIPSCGFPVSDPFFTIWDSTGIRLPQMYVGRIPLNSSSEMDYYRSKVQNNVDKPYDDWNKKYLFFSGGRANVPDEIALYKSVNDSVINNYIIPSPLAGVYHHFYKTSNPLTDFGPYSSSYINDAILDGAVFISYIGHSGTATWDNSISDIRQLKNGVNRNPVISDFGCSTNKFAEPDIVCFGERFILDPEGQALGYIGNSALGFVSTAIKAPGDFYKYVIQDTIFQVGKAHYSAKWLMFQQLGSSNVVNEFSFSSTLMGDPIVKMQVPNRPNLAIKQDDIILGDNFINDGMDSIEVKLALNNFGTVISQTFKLNFTHSYHNSTVNQIEQTLSLPNFSDTLSFWINIKEKPGQHTIQINLDTDNSLAEIYENDNNVSVQFDVASSNIRDIFVNRNENPKLDSLLVLLPTVKSEKQLLLNLEIADNEQFTNPSQYNYGLDTFFTKINLSTPVSNNRSWLRYKADDQNEWSNPLSYSKLSGSKYFIGDNYSWGKQDLSQARILNDKAQLSIDTINLSIIAAGSYRGEYCIISKNGINLLSNTFFKGIGIVVFNEKTLAVDTTVYYELFNLPVNVTACANFINSIPTGKLVALGVGGDAKNNLTTALSNAVVSLGGTRFPSIQYKAPYALFGKKGADSLHVKQMLKNPNEDPIYLDTNIVVPFNSGVLTTTQVGPSSEWKKLKVAVTNQNNSEIKFRPLGVKRDGTVDTLSYVSIINNEADLSSIPATTYAHLKIRSELKADSILNSPQLSKLEVDYKGIAELGTNFQAVKINKDTLEQGQKGKITFYVYNAGEASANNFLVEVDVLRPDNTSEILLEQAITTLTPGQRTLLAAGFPTEFESGDRIYKINIDPQNQVLEYYEDNNIFLHPFFIKRDTTKPIIAIYFDGNEVFDGDYVSSNPKIRMELSDPSILPIYDTSSLTIHLDDSPVYFAKNTNILSYQFNPENPKMVVEYTPTLEEGEHTLKIMANDGFGNLADSIGLIKRFVVSNETAISNIYNYPNPVTNNTYFTFELASQLPDGVRILVYTIAGRMVKEVKVPQGDLKANFNKIPWDTRDEDGDLLGNGTYLYKVIMNAGNKTETSVHKLAIVR